MLITTYLSKVSLLNSVAVELLTLAENGDSVGITLGFGQTDAGFTLKAVGMRGACCKLLFADSRQFGDVEVVVVGVLSGGNGGKGGNFV